jgi:hypothetical protein
MELRPGQQIESPRWAWRSRLLAGCLASCSLCLSLFVAEAQGAKTYPSCNGLDKGASCIVGTSYGAVFDGNPGKRYKLCIKPSGRDRRCKKFTADGEAHLFGGGQPWDADYGRGYSFIMLTGISVEPTSPATETGQPFGHINLRWWKDGRKIDSDKLTLLVGD